MKQIFLLLLVFFSLTACKKNSKGGNDTNPPPTASGFAKGADISWVTQMEAAGIKFYNSSGTEQECMALMKSLGMNTVRLRVWVNPSPAWNNAADVLTKA